MVGRYPEEDRLGKLSTAEQAPGYPGPPAPACTLNTREDAGLLKDYLEEASASAMAAAQKEAKANATTSFMALVVMFAWVVFFASVAYACMRAKGACSQHAKSE